MDANEIIEGNKLIANFMAGYSTKSNHNFYHESWNELMPVVEKIEGTKQADIVIHAKNLVQISYNKETKTYFSGSLLQNTWDACVEFIEWYNQNI